MDQVSKIHHATAKSVDFSSPNTLKEINQQITDATNGLLKDTINQIDPMVVCVLVNTIYFKGLWASKFDAKKTTNMSFHKLDKS